MLYVTVPLSFGGNSSLPRYGLRIGEFHKRPTSPQLVAVAPVQRELIDLHIVANSEVRVVFGKRLVWDIPRGAFGRQSNTTTFAIEVPIKTIRRSDLNTQQAGALWDPTPWGMSVLSNDPVRTRRGDGERPASVSIIIPLHLTAGDGRHAYMHVRPTVDLRNQQPGTAAPGDAGARTNF